MEWLLEGVIDSAIETSSDRVVVLSLEPEDLSLDGTMFTCRATTIDGVQHEQSITVVVEGEFLDTIIH